MNKADNVLDRRSLQLRKRIVDMMVAAGRGHLASALSLVEILRVLYDDVLQYKAEDPKWPDRDRCILSKGHGCMAQYVLLAEKGFFADEELAKFCKADGILGGHPETKAPGIEASTGSLGHGLSIGVGMALHGKISRAGYRVFVIVGDGECNEGSIWEAAMVSAKHKLSNLTVLVDYNKCTTYGPISEVQDVEPLVDKWASFGFVVKEADGHDVGELKRNLEELPFLPPKPNALICHTLKGKGIKPVEEDYSWHHKSKLKSEEIAMLYAELGAS